MSIWSSIKKAATSANTVKTLKLGAGLYGAKKAYDAGKSADKAARRNARRVEREGAEKKRRARQNQRRTQSTLRANAAASGVKVGGSTANYMTKYINEDERQLEWLQESIGSQADILRKAGKDAKKSGKYGAYGSFFSTVSDWLGS